MFGLIFSLMLPTTPYGVLVETPTRVTIGQPAEGRWWATGAVEKQGTVLLLWTSPDGRKAYGQYLRNGTEFRGAWTWIEDAEFDETGCLGGDVHQERIAITEP